MFSSNDELLDWANSIGLSHEATSIIRRIRESEPARRVRSGPKNVSGRYPSRKMNRTIQFESHKNELAYILELEHDEDAIEYWDQPSSIKLSYKAKNGKQLAIIHTPDFFVIKKNCAVWVECKTEDELVKLAEKQPNRFVKDKEGRWRCPPGEDYGFPYKLYYRIHSTSEIDWTYQRNVHFLEDYLRCEEIELPKEIVTYFQAIVVAKPGIVLSELIKRPSYPFGVHRIRLFRHCHCVNLKVSVSVALKSELCAIGRRRWVAIHSRNRCKPS